MFGSDRDVIEDLTCSGRPSTSATEVKEIVIGNSLSTLRKSVELSVSHVLIRTILNNHFGIKHVAAQLVPKDLRGLQKLNRMSVTALSPIIHS